MSYIEQFIERVDDLTRFVVGKNVDDLAMLCRCFRINQIPYCMRLVRQVLSFLSGLLLPLGVNNDLQAQGSLRLGEVEGMAAESLVESAVVLWVYAGNVERPQLLWGLEAQPREVARHSGWRKSDGNGGASRSTGHVGVANLQKFTRAHGPKARAHPRPSSLHPRGSQHLVATARSTLFELS